MTEPRKRLDLSRLELINTYHKRPDNIVRITVLYKYALYGEIEPNYEYPDDTTTQLTWEREQRARGRRLEPWESMEIHSVIVPILQTYLRNGGFADLTPMEYLERAYQCQD